MRTEANTIASSILLGFGVLNITIAFNDHWLGVPLGALLCLVGVMAFVSRWATKTEK